MSDEVKGMLLGVIGVAIFSLTLPATRVAVSVLDPVIVGLGRAVVAAAVAAAILFLTRQPIPARRTWFRLLMVALCLVIGFPLFMTIAMRSVPASHGGVVLGVLPLATTVGAALFCGERPSIGFWAMAVLGSALVLAFAFMDGAGALQVADLWLLAAVFIAGSGYALSGNLSRFMGSWQVICWVVVAALPFTVPPVLWVAGDIDWPATSWQVWAGFFYVALFSQLIGFFAWNRGMVMGGVSRVGQVQLLQLFMTLAASWLLLGEEITPTTIVFAMLVVAVVAWGRRMPVSRPD
ncbi:MAG: DMT family transporter [Proteobacteria bacterium]|nr:DMT family transporter [Pseudomonadota bacterium]MDA1023467.1 DMT family transporter [Pseudomonadota bacterium]